MYEFKKLDTIDPQNPYAPKFSGIFEQTVIVGEKTRRFLAYVPDTIRESTAGVLVLGENGKTADDLLRDSGWREIAEQEECKEKLIVFFLESENGHWNTDEAYGISDGDVAYIDAAYAKATERYLYCVHESKVYLTGCREGGVLAQMAAMWNPAVYAGLVTVGGSTVATDYISAAKQDFCTNLDGYVDETHRKDIHKGEIPLPAWIIDDPSTLTGVDNGSAAYWRAGCGTDETPHQILPDVWEYSRSTEPPYMPNQEKEAFRVCVSTMEGSSADSATPLLRRIWKDFLYLQRRWMSGPGGDLRVTRDPVRDLGMEYHFEEVDGWMREWYVYVPESVKASPIRPVPLVFAMHGYTCSGEIYAGNSEWYKVARDYGFIVVHPTALPGCIEMENDAIDPHFTPLPAWNVFQEDDRPDELNFFKTVLDRVSSSYTIDSSRVYATGHSWGSLMTQMLALALPEQFAAVAPCSGVFFGGAEKRMLSLPALADRPDVELPVWMFCGEEEPWLIPAQPTAENETGFTISMWLDKNHMTDQIPVRWEQCQPLIHGRWSDLTFEKNGVPMVRYTTVDYMPHATMTEMSYRIWEGFFSKFSRIGDKTIYQDSSN